MRKIRLYLEYVTRRTRTTTTTTTTTFKLIERDARVEKKPGLVSSLDKRFFKGKRGGVGHV